MKLRNILPITLTLLALASCSPVKKIVYLQDMVPGLGYDTQSINEVTIQPGDKLRISVASKNPELAIPFNANAVAVSSDGAITPTETGMDYRVDPSGNIDFPVLNQLHVANLTLTSVRDLIKELIQADSYIKDPIVNVELINLRYTVLGAVRSNGTYSTDEGRITLLEALANAGNVSETGRVDKVTVIREERGLRTMYVHDLRSKDIFDSPCYYLKQNDIIYVEPKYLTYNRNENRAWQFASIGLTAASVACTLLMVLK